MKNRTHTCALPNKTPFEMVNHKKPNLHATHQWGSEVYVKIKQGDKLSLRATRAHWIGFSSQSDRHCIYWPESHNVIVERNILFNKEKLHRYSPILPTDDVRYQSPIDLQQSPFRSTILRYTLRSQSPFLFLLHLRHSSVHPCSPCLTLHPYVPCFTDIRFYATMILSSLT